MTFAMPRDRYEPRPDIATALAVVRCYTCGVVAHQPIPEDEFHCPCRAGYDGEYGTAYRDGCPCECHERDE